MTRRTPPVHRCAGFSLVEVLAGLLILCLIITTSIGIFFERERRLQQARELVLVWQAIANEAEIRRHVSYHSLVPGEQTGFVSDTALLITLEGATPSVSVEEIEPGVRVLHLAITWSGGQRSADASIIRTDTGGGNLW
ncbi:MAG TPA: prepilin-type N-terminal cleavage/methylation domain-containing protein [Thermoanaerobaculia bacterium]|nr:prepilin-type N-terminal cleavage/methylation domain-containing protein [Thermoanaerobaculia bacterium]